MIVGTKLRLPQQVAIKRMHDSLQFSPSDQRRFVREVLLLARLNHPNIVEFLGAFQEQDQHYLIMEYVDGGSLADRLRQDKKLSTHQAIRIALEVSDALARAHHLKIIHRDLKPANVLPMPSATCVPE